MADTTVNLGRVTNRMAWIYGVLFSLNALTTCLIASLSNAKWASLDSQSKFLMVVVIFGNWSGVIMAFLSKTVARMEAGKDPIPSPGNGTDQFTKAPNGTVTQTNK